MKNITDINPADWFKVVLFGILISVLYYSSFSWLVFKDWDRQDYTYGWIIPAVILYLVWENRKQFLQIPVSPSWTGSILFFLGIICFWLGELSGEFFTQYVSFSLILVGLCWMIMGWQKLKPLLFALVFTLAMFPPPNIIHDKITFHLKLISSQLGVEMLHLYGMSAFREGNVIDLGFTQLQVVDACSGLRYLFPLLIMGFLLAYFFRTSLWKKILLVISTVPLTIITNSLRIALTGILSEAWGPDVAEGFFHGFSGWFIFMFGLGILLIGMFLLNRIFPESKAQGTGLKAQGSATEKESELVSQDARKFEIDTLQTFKINSQTTNGFEPLALSRKPTVKKGLAAFFHPPQFVVAVILLGLTLVLAQGVEFREKIPIAKSFDKFPLKVAGWNGNRESMEQKFIDTLDLNDYVIVDYMNDDRKQVNFYTAYYESQRKGESIHSPATCLPGGGWEFSQAGGTTIPVQYNGSNSMPVNRAYMVKGEYRQLSYYWFPQRDRILTNAYQLKLYNFWDALTQQRTDGALVRLITPVYDGEEVVDAEERLIAFTREIVPVLDEFLPK